MAPLWHNVRISAVCPLPTGGGLDGQPDSPYSGCMEGVTLTPPWAQRTHWKLLSYRDNYNALLGYMHRGLDFRLKGGETDG